MNYSYLKRTLAHRMGKVYASVLFFGGTMALSSCQDDLLTGTPEWLGSSIYEELEERGAFTQTLALINDPDLSDTNYPEMLRRTGSMTFFVADDAAWSRFLAKRGVSSVSQLSKAEKKNLLKSSMINNAYLIDLLSNTPGNPPSEGTCMRRTTRADVEDSIPVLLASQMPPQASYRDNYVDHWADVRDRSSIKIFMDGNTVTDSKSAPMVHFLPRYMSQNSITGSDLSYLTNGVSNSIERSYINGHPIAANTGRWAERDVESTGIAKKYLQDITCQNGYIHIIEEVPEPLGNMAEIIASQPQFSIFSKLLERFSYPAIYTIQDRNGEKDTFYTKRYFNSSLNHGLGDYTKIDGTTVTVDDKLSIDPGWSNYVLYTALNQYTIADDAAAMFVPNDEQMNAYLHGDGLAIGTKYGFDWDKVPDNLVAPFLNNCIQKSFRATVPSKFAAMKNTAAEPMNITAADIRKSFMACNGVVYEVGNVFAAPEHEAVVFPALLRADETGDMKLSNKVITYDPTSLGSDQVETDIRNAWKLHEFKAYLNSMSSTYSFLLPSDQAYLYYIDPYSYTSGQKPTAFVFYLDADSKEPVLANAYYLDEDGNLTDKEATKPDISIVANRLYDIMDNCIIVHGQRGAQTFNPERTVYLTKANSPVTVGFTGNNVTSIAGSMQVAKGEVTPIDPATQVFDMTEKGNGVTYLMNAMPQTTVITPDSLINDIAKYPEYEAFAYLLRNSSLREKTESLNGKKTIGHPINLFGNYHYTVYIPQNSVIDALTTAGKLPSKQQLEEWETYLEALKEYDESVQGLSEEDEAARKAEKNELLAAARKDSAAIFNSINNFIRYHVQDGSVFLGGEQVSGELHETSSVDTLNNRFRTVSVTNTGNAITVKVPDTSIEAHVIAGNHSNQMSRQYLFDGSTKTIFSSSYVVTHLIDNALYYSDEQFLPSTITLPTYPAWLPKPVDPGSDPEQTTMKRFSNAKKYRK